MLKVTTLFPIEGRYITEEVQEISSINVNVRRIGIPYKRKIKRKDRAKITKMLEHEESVFVEDLCLKEFERNVQKRSWLYYLLEDGLMYVLKNAEATEIALVIIDFTHLAKQVILYLSNFYRVLTVYTLPDFDYGNFFDEIYFSIGLPIKVKTLTPETNPDEKYLIRISEDISVCDKAQNTEIYDLKLKFLHPLCKFENLPLENILKVLREKGECQTILQSGLVKIMGVMSK